MAQMRSRLHLAFAVAGLTLLAVLASLPLPRATEAGVNLGIEPTATPIATPTATPTAMPTPLQPPAAPTNLHYQSGSFVWEDNSDNEDGFRLRRWAAGYADHEVVATVPANTTSVRVPEDPEVCGTFSWSVVAFNAAGESAPAVDPVVVIVDYCGYEPPPTPTPSPTSEPAGFPPTGGGPAGGAAANDWLLAVGGLGVALAALGGAAFVRARSHPVRC